MSAYQFHAWLSEFGIRHPSLWSSVRLARWNDGGSHTVVPNL